MQSHRGPVPTSDPNLLPQERDHENLMDVTSTTVTQIPIDSASTVKDLQYEERSGNSIERTFFANHEKISLLSSLGMPCTQMSEGPREVENVDQISTCSSGNRTCRICLSCQETKRTRLISPCRCKGSISYVHAACLVRWIDLNERKLSRSVPRCELCGFRFKRRGVFIFEPTRLMIPSVGLRDKVLNCLFLLLLLIMGFCGWVAFHYLQLSIRRSTSYRAGNVLLDEDDMTMFAATVLLVVAFFLAVFTQYRAETPVCHVLARFWTTNRNWQICEYDATTDFERLQIQPSKSQLQSLA
ncbi:Zinc finger domain containing protein [Aphelenchoides besseyi]|nr:Zinc finger domain containing protein [Aphelenchoides besseyi]